MNNTELTSLTLDDYVDNFHLNENPEMLSENIQMEDSLMHHL